MQNMQRLRVMPRGEESRTPLNNKHDGDMCSLTFAMTDESVAEIKALLANRDYYVGVNGEVTFSASNDISDLIFAEMTTP